MTDPLRLLQRVVVPLCFLFHDRKILQQNNSKTPKKTVEIQ